MPGSFSISNSRHHAAIHRDELPTGAVLNFAADLLGDLAVESNPGADEQCSQGAEAAARELNGGKHVLLAHYPCHRIPFDFDIASLQLFQAGPIQIAAIRVEGGRPPIGNEQRLLQRYRRNVQDTQALPTHFISVAIGAMEHRFAPPLRQARNVWQNIGYTECQE